MSPKDQLWGAKPAIRGLWFMLAVERQLEMTCHCYQSLAAIKCVELLSTARASEANIPSFAAFVVLE